MQRKPEFVWVDDVAVSLDNLRVLCNHLQTAEFLLRHSATYFSANHAVRTEATAVLDERATLWGAHTFNEDSYLAGSTFVRRALRLYWLAHLYEMQDSPGTHIMSLRRPSPETCSSCCLCAACLPSCTL